MKNTKVQRLQTDSHIVYKETKVNDRIHLSSEKDSEEALSDYDFIISIDAMKNWEDLAAILDKSGLKSKHYSFTTVFNRHYKSLPRASIDNSEFILHLDPLSLHGSVHSISRFLQSLQPPTVMLIDANNQTLCSFYLDFERFALNLACCPSDASISEGTVYLNDTVELSRLLDNTQSCPAVFDNLIHLGCTLGVTLSLRKLEMEPLTSDSVVKMDSSTQVDVLNRKLKNLEEFQKETVSHYEKELEAKQRTIYLLTQANREFEQLCVGSVMGENSVELKNENLALKKKVEELTMQIAQLQREKDEMREVMVRVCTTGKQE
ncbi:hypothetical protein JH06_2692 [Blastocystis sp. subtype 4]|uniref:hypothetical protein n=1 Tax=Blastocystis sp. subtype 4 TaxID=944170 RepID=UPI0007121086|nr:hypothetical protein JH06_2692 [Blastocystis sp. subtype 4]KNB43457.1 hypothetical protein JH06_2692 [Blastocystis sp. subtype 4]|eukprot:XP_014526900.1 hypothetical protein JH06_2692 [Blastocystis sp. subtype 4]